jgi:hypothetical protein
MRAYPSLFTSIGVLILVGVGFSLGAPALGASGLVLLAAWITCIYPLTGKRVTGLLLLLSTALAAIEAFEGGNIYALLCALTLVLVGWESFQASLPIIPFSRPAKQSFFKQHLGPVLTLEGIGLLLAVLALQVHVHLSFRLGLSLALAALLLLGLLLRSLAGPRPDRGHGNRRG